MFGEAVRDELLKMKNSPERASYILMKRVHPVVYRNYPIAANCPVELAEVVSELGVFGYLLAYVTFLSCIIIVLRSQTRVISTALLIRGHSMEYIPPPHHRRRSRGDQVVRTPQKFDCGFVSLENVLICQGAESSPRTPRRELIALHQAS